MKTAVAEIPAIAASLFRVMPASFPFDWSHSAQWAGQSTHASRSVSSARPTSDLLGRYVGNTELGEQRLLPPHPRLVLCPPGRKLGLEPLLPFHPLEVPEQLPQRRRALWKGIGWRGLNLLGHQRGQRGENAVSAIGEAQISQPIANSA